MNSQFLKNEIKAYLKDDEVLTKGEVNELLKDCLSYFEKQDEKRSQFHDAYEGIMSNAKKQREEAASLLQNFGQLGDMLKNMRGQANEEEK